MNYKKNVHVFEKFQTSFSYINPVCFELVFSVQGRNTKDSRQVIIIEMQSTSGFVKLQFLIAVHI